MRIRFMKQFTIAIALALAGATLPAPAAVVGKHRATVDIPLARDGTYRITLASANVMGSYTLGGETKRFRATGQTVKNEVPGGGAQHPPGEHAQGEHDLPPEGARYTYSATLDVLPE